MEDDELDEEQLDEELVLLQLVELEAELHELLYEGVEQELLLDLDEQL